MSSYLACESVSCFNFVELSTKIKKEIKKRHPRMLSTDRFKLLKKSLSKFAINGQTFTYDYMNNNLGGFRAFVYCPKCNRTWAKLYLPVGKPGKEQRYLCKECHGLKNRSAMMGKTSTYTKVIRPLKRLEKLRDKLLSKRIAPNEAVPLLEEYERTKKELEASIEYKLWKFHQEQEMLRKEQANQSTQ